MSAATGMQGEAAAATPRRRTVLGLGRGVLGGMVALVVLLAVCIQLLLLTVPLYTMHLVDGQLESGHSDTIIYLSLLLVVVVALISLLHLLRAGLLHAAAERVERRLFLLCSSAALAHGRAGRPAMAATVLRDFNELRGFVNGHAPADALDLIAIPIGLTFLFLMHPLYGWFALAGCLLLCFMGWVTDRAAKRNLRRASALAAEASSRLQQRLRHRDEVEGLGLLPAILRRWRRLQAAALTAQGMAERRAKSVLGFTQLISHTMSVGKFMLGIWLAIHNEVTIGSVMAAAMLIAMILHPATSIAQSWFAWTMARVSYQRLRELLPEEDGAVAAAPLAEAPPGLLLSDVTVEVPNRIGPLVQDLSLCIPPGQVLAITGPNGAGKSTLLRTLIGLRPTPGRVLLDGLDLHAASRDEVGPRIGLLSQRPHLLEGTVLENIARFSGDSPGAIAAARLARVHEMIGRLPRGYASPAGAGSGLSGGQQRMVALARAVFGPPRLILLDEPEAALDEAGVRHLRETVGELRERGAIVVLVTHDVAGWLGIADQELQLTGNGDWQLVPLDDTATQPDERTVA